MERNKSVYLWIINAIRALENADDFLSPNEMAEINEKIYKIKRNDGTPYKSSLHDNMQTHLDRVSKLENGDFPNKYKSINNIEYIFFIKKKSNLKQRGETKYKLVKNWRDQLNLLIKNNPNLNENNSYFETNIKNFSKD